MGFRDWPSWLKGILIMLIIVYSSHLFFGKLSFYRSPFGIDWLILIEVLFFGYALGIMLDGYFKNPGFIVGSYIPLIIVLYINTFWSRDDLRGIGIIFLSIILISLAFILGNVTKNFSTLNNIKTKHWLIGALFLPIVTLIFIRYGLGYRIFRSIIYSYRSSFKNYFFLSPFIGALIGFIIGKLKSRNQTQDLNQKDNFVKR